MTTQSSTPFPWSKVGNWTLLGLMTGPAMVCLLHVYVLTRDSRNYFLEFAHDPQKNAAVLIQGALMFGIWFALVIFTAGLVSAAFRTSRIFVVTYFAMTIAGLLCAISGPPDGWLFMTVPVMMTGGAIFGLVLGLCFHVATILCARIGWFAKRAEQR